MRRLVSVRAGIEGPIAASHSQAPLCKAAKTDSTVSYIGMRFGKRSLLPCLESFPEGPDIVP